MVPPTCRAASSAGRPIFKKSPRVLFSAPGVVKIGFLAKKYSDFTRFHNFSTDFWKSWFSKIVICLKLAQNHVFKRVWDDLEAGIGISIQKKKLSRLRTCFWCMLWKSWFSPPPSQLQKRNQCDYKMALIQKFDRLKHSNSLGWWWWQTDSSNFQ